MREIRTKMVPSASETPQVTATVGDIQETEEQEISEVVDETIELEAVAHIAPEGSEETAVCNSCVVLKAKVVALQKTCSRLRQKAAGVLEKPKLPTVISKDPFEESSSHEESEHSSEIRTDDPPSQASFDPEAEGSESSEILTTSEDDDNESRNKIRLVYIVS